MNTMNIALPQLGNSCRQDHPLRFQTLAARLAACAVTAALLALPRLCAAATLGQVDTFEDGTTDGWGNGGGNVTPNSSNINSGGPAGAGDHYMQVVSGTFGGDSHMVVLNRAQWTGNYVAAGITEITMNLRNFGASAIPIRIAIRESTLLGAPGYCSTVAYSLAADGQWHTATFLLDAADMTPIGSAQPLATDLASVAELRILSSASPALTGDAISAEIGVDNILATTPCLTITCPAAVNNIVCSTAVPAAATTSAEFTTQGGTITDNCNCQTSGYTVTSTDAISSSNCPNQYVITRTYTVTNGCGDGATCTQKITVSDTVVPTIDTCPTGTYLGCNPAAANQPTCATVSAQIQASDNCGGLLTTNCAAQDSDNGCTHTRQFTITVVDSCNNTSAPCVVTYTWTIDTAGPVFTNCPGNINLGCNPATIPGCDPTVGAGDDCSVTNISCSYVDATNGCAATRTLTYAAVDGCNKTNTCTQVISWTVDAVQSALDTANNSDYAPQPNNSWSTVNGGYGYNLWTAVTDTGGGGTYMEGSRQVDGNWSFAIYAGTGGYDISRALTNSMIAGEFSILTRFDSAGNNLNLVNLRAGNNTSGFGAGELLSFGLVNGNLLTYTDGTGLHVLPSGEARGSVWAWDVVFNAAAGTYTLSVTNLDVANGYATVVSGNLEPNGSSVGSFAVVNTSTGFNQNLIFDQAKFTASPVPIITNCPSAPIALTGCNPTRPSCSSVLALAGLSASAPCPTSFICAAGAVQTNNCSLSQVFTYNAVDSCNHTSAPCNVTVTWKEDTTPPTITTCPPGGFVACNPAQGALPTCASVTAQIQATDNCPGVLVTNCVAAADITNGCTVTRQFTIEVVDSCNNTSAPCVVTYTWTEDTTPPTFNCPGSAIGLGCNPLRPTCAIAKSHAPVSDNCDLNPQVLCAAGNVLTNGCQLSQTFSLLAYDSCNNTSAPCNVTFTWTEEAPPTFNPQPFQTCGATNFLGCNPDLTTIPHCSVAIGATSPCGTPRVTCSLVQTTNGCVVTRILTYVAASVCNTSVCSQVYIWTQDTTSPTFTKCPGNLNLGCNPATIPDCDTSAGNVAATDTCSTPVITCAKNDATNGCVRTRTLVYTATDACGNTKTCTQTITWTEDTTLPVFTNCPAATLNLGCNPPAANIPTCSSYTVGATDNCSVPTVTCAQVTVTNGCVRTRTLTWTAKDACNNSVTCSQTITWTVDTAVPVFTNCPASTNLGCNPTSVPDCNPAVGATATCGVTNISCSRVDTTNGCTRTRTLTYIALDACSNAASCTQVITWSVDLTGPVFTNCPADVNLGCNPTTIPDCDPTVGVSDPCGAPVTCSKVDATNGCVRTRTLTYSAQDLCGNSAMCTQVITWTVDTTKPVFVNCPVATTNLGCNPTSIPTCADYNVTATDSCSSAPVTCSSVDATNGCVVTRTLTFTATDSCGNSNTCNQVITWTEDTTAPVITCPNDTTAQCGQTGTNITGVATATDNCVGPVVISYSDTTATGTCPTNYIITRTWKAVDACGNSITCPQTIWVLDNAGPVFTNCPGNINLGCNPATIPVCDPTVGAKADCGLTLSCGYSDATNGCNRTRTITYTATDSCNNSNTCTQVITWTEDTTPPAFNPQPFPTCGATNFLGCNPDLTTIPHCSVGVSATDNCGPARTTCSLLQTTNGCVVTRILTYVATDPCGNSNVCSQVFVWTQDTTSPTFTKCPGNLNLGCNPTTIPDCDTSPGNVAATDTCTVPVITCARHDATNGCIATRTLVYTATDGCGNTKTCTQTITWTIDTTAPVFTNCPAANLPLGCNPPAASIPTCSTYAVGATDNCSTPTVTCAQVTVTNGCLRTRTLTWTAKDACNNTATCSQVVTWTVDTDLPVFTNCPAPTLNLGCNPASIPDCDPNVGATDSCGVSVTCARSDVTNGCFRTRTLTYTAVDICNNSNTCTQVITWKEDTDSPVFTNCPANINLGCNPQTIPDCDPNVGASDTCPVTVTCSKLDATNGCARTRTLTYTALDVCSNSAVCTQVISWTVDTVLPVFTNCPANVNLGCNPQTVPDCDPNVGASDNCTVTNISCSRVDSTNGCARTRTLTYTAQDECNNVGICTQVISWTEDTTAPVITCPTNTTAQCGSTGTNFTGTATATDDCSGNIVITFSDVTVPGICPTNYIITRTWKAVDACTNASTCDQTIWVLDNAGPVFTNCPANRSLGCNPATIPGCDPTVGAKSDCGLTMYCASVDATNGCNRTRTITYTAVDGCNNTNTCTQVLSWTEEAPPTFNPQPFQTCGATNFLGCNPDLTTIPHCSVAIGATSPCGTPRVTCSLVQTTNGCVVTRILTYVAASVCNTSVCSQVYIWTQDTTSPTFTKCPGNLNLGCNPGTIPDCDTSAGNVAATDTCSTPVITCAKHDATNGCVATRTLVYTATDGCGNTKTCTQTITWTVDNAAPVFTNCPTPSTLDLGTNPPPASIPTCNSYTVGATDNCSTPTVTCAQSTVTNGCVRTRTLTWTAKDACNNTATCTQTITWAVDPPPVLGVVIQGTHVIITWPVTCIHYNLESTPDITPPSTWSPAGTPTVVNGQNTVTNGLGANTFYRLRFTTGP